MVLKQGLNCVHVFYSQYYHGEAYFVKVHCTFDALAKGAEELLIPMPIKVCL